MVVDISSLMIILVNDKNNLTSTLTTKLYLTLTTLFCLIGNYRIQVYNSKSDIT